MKLEDFLAELKDITGKLEAGAAVEKAAAAPVETPVQGGGVVVTDVKDLATKALDDSRILEQKRLAGSDHKTKLAGLFNKLASANKELSHLGSNEALDNPTEYLRRKELDRNGRAKYVLKEPALEAMLQTAMRMGAGQAGKSFSEWSGDGIAKIATSIEKGLSTGAFGKDADVLSKALDTTSGGPLIRTDLEPLIYEAYLRTFPALEAMQTVEANGVRHTFNRRSGVGTAVTLAELGDLTAADGQSTFSQVANSNIAVIAAKRSISLKAQYAVRQSGMNYNLENLETMGAFTAISKKNQYLLMQGNVTDNTGTLNNEKGLYDANGYDGLRIILSDAGTSLTKSGGDTYLDIINRGVAQIGDAGGDVDNLMIFTRYGGRLAINKELQTYLRVVDGTPGNGFASNLSANGLVTVSDWPSQLMNVPGATQPEGIGFYDISATSYEDMYLCDPRGMALAYLGSAIPVMLELPIGYNNALSNVYITFLMNGLVVHIPTFHRKIRIAKQTV